MLGTLQLQSTSDPPPQRPPHGTYQLKTIAKLLIAALQIQPPHLSDYRASLLLRRQALIHVAPTSFAFKDASNVALDSPYTLA
jgi:hypothetical protein